MSDWEKDKRRRRHTSTEGRRNCLHSIEVIQSEWSLEGRGHRWLWQRCTHHRDPTWWQLRVVVCIVSTESGYASHRSRHLSSWLKMQVTIILTNSMSNMIHHRRITQTSIVQPGLSAECETADSPNNERSQETMPVRKSCQQKRPPVRLADYEHAETVK